jgi:hypothetical protein
MFSAQTPETGDDFIDRMKSDYLIIHEKKAIGFTGGIMWSIINVVSVAEYVGRVTADALGLTASRYQFVERELEHMQFVQSFNDDGDLPRDLIQQTKAPENQSMV